jgi:very-short-patch-repair endonuclease
LDPANSKITANEEFVYFNTRTSHKRYESMVLYALHFALRDVQILSQYHVLCEQTDYYIDAYMPAINLAIEIDEPYHQQQVNADKKRELAIKHKLGCDFFRVVCSESIYAQVDKIIARINSANLRAWLYKRPQPNQRTGEYSDSNWNALKQAGIPEMMDAFMANFEMEGYAVEHGKVNGVPSPSNGEYGFLLKYKGFIVAIYARKSGKVRITVVHLADNISEGTFKAFLEPRQMKNNKPKYYVIKKYLDSLNNTEDAKKAVDWLVSSKLFVD